MESEGAGASTESLIFLPNLSFAFFASVAVKGVASETGLAEC